MGYPNDHLEEMFDDVEAFQRELGLDPRIIPSDERHAVESDMLLGLHEETGALQRSIGHYKRHILAAVAEAAKQKGMPGSGEQQNIATHISDVIRYLLIIGQLHGIDLNTLMCAWRAKSEVIRARAHFERVELQEHTRVACFDVDDVIADLTAWPREFNDINGTNGREHLKLSEQYKDRFHSSGAFRDLPIMPGAREGLQAFREAGYKIVLITARPVWQYRMIHAETLEWLRKHEVPHDLLLFSKDKCGAIHKHLHPAWPKLFVEDHPRNAIAIAQLGIPVLLYDQPHNQLVPESPGIRRVRGWDDIMAYMVDIGG